MAKTTLRQSIEDGERGGFVTRLYEAYCALRVAGNKVDRAFCLADMGNRRKMLVALPGCDGKDGIGDYQFLSRKLEEQFPALLHLDAETDNPHQFRF